MIQAVNRIMKIRHIACLASAVVLALMFPLQVDAEASSETNEAPAAKAYRFTEGAESVRFPFDIYRGDIRFAAQINGHDVHLLLDDGFMWDPVLFWGGPEVDALKLDEEGELSIGDEGDSNAIAATTASGFEIHLPGIDFLDQTAVITPSSSGTAAMWAGSVGQVSGTFLKNMVVDIDFDAMMITLIEPEGFEYPGKGVAVPWTPLEVGAWSIPGTLVLADGRSIHLDLMMDLGYNDQAQIATNSHHRIQLPERVLPGTLGFNIQREETRGYFARLQKINIGGFGVEDVLVSFVAEEQNDQVHHEVMIGLGLLSRFNLTFDFSRQMLYVEPNKSFGHPFERDMSGLDLGRSDGESVAVNRVHPGSPAEEAGIKSGDRVVTINGKPAIDYGYWELLPFFKREGAAVGMTLLREGEKYEVSFVLRRVI